MTLASHAYSVEPTDWLTEWHAARQVGKESVSGVPSPRPAERRQSLIPHQAGDHEGVAKLVSKLPS